MIKVIQVEKHDDGNSYLIDFKNGMKLWFDTWRDADGEFTGDWNKYIFNTKNDDDMAIQAFQNYSDDECGAINFSNALEICEDYELQNKK